MMGIHGLAASTVHSKGTLEKSAFPKKVNSSIRFERRQEHNLSQEPHLLKRIAKSYLRFLKIYLSLIAASLAINETLPILYSSVFTKTGKPAAKSKWSPNVKVLASSSQKHLTWGFEYLIGLLNTYTRPDVHNLDEAQALMMKQGYTVPITRILPGLQTTEFPTATPNNLGGFEKGDKTKQRYIFSFCDSENIAKLGVEEFNKAFREEFNIPGDHVIFLKNPNRKQIAEQLQKLSAQIKSLPPGSAEVLMFYIGHGNTKEFFPAGDEGNATGKFEIQDGLYEPELQKLVNENLGNATVYAILNTCFSGSWICQDKTPQTLSTPGYI